MTDLCFPACATADQPVQSPWLGLEWQHYVEATARSQHARDFAQHGLGRLDVLQHVEDPDEIELTICEGQALRGGQAKINAFR